MPTQHSAFDLALEIGQFQKLATPAFKSRKNRFYMLTIRDRLQELTAERSDCNHDYGVNDVGNGRRVCVRVLR